MNITMNICVLTLIRSYEGSEKKYSAQDIGLGKAFAELKIKTNVVRFEKRSSKCYIEKYGDFLTVSHYKVPAIGENSILIKRHLPKDCDVMICFSDIQVAFFQVCHHCKKYKIVLIPYIGVIESHSDNLIKRFIMKFFCWLNLRKYRILNVCAKTEDVKRQLLKKKVDNVVVTPVGLDTNSLVTNVSTEQREKLRMEIIPSYIQSCKVVLFVGKLIPEKRPLDVVNIFFDLYKKDNSFRLLVIGKGTLKAEVQEFANNHGLNEVVKLLEDVPNKDMWKYYVSAECLLNLSKVEIFGMSILEAMYYECPVVAYAAPGPRTIITDEYDGYLFENIEAAVSLVEKAIKRGRLKNARKTIENRYTWHSKEKKMLQLI